MTNPPATSPTLMLSAVTQRRDGREVLADIDLRISERRVALIGRNGSGKSTLIRLLAGLVAPDSGTVRIDGYDVAADRKAALRLVGVLFQNPDHQIIFPTVVEELAFGLRQLGQAQPEDTARDVLRRFNRHGWAERPVHTLSQGQRHLVCLMSVLAMAPRVILLDEPMAGLDLPTITQLTALLDGLPQTILHATHDLDQIGGYDRVLWLEQGRVAGDGPPAQVVQAYRDAMERAQDAFADLTG